MVKLLFYFISINLSAQALHHQMISSQGGKSGSNVLFTVGQQSVIGSNSNGAKFIVQQGFQQSNWNKIVLHNTVSINTIVYPNPFKDIVYFSFSKSPSDKIGLVVFDVLGRLVYSEISTIKDNLISVNLINLPSGEYFVKLSSDNYTFSTKILKQ